MTAGSVAAASAIARRRLRHAFEEAEAYSPERAIGFEPQRRFERRWFERLLASGAIVEARPGAFYMDRDRFDAEDQRRRVRKLAMIGTALAATLAIFGISQL